MTDTLLIDRSRDGIAVVTLNRPDRLNAVNEEMRDALIQTFTALGADRSVLAVVLTGAGRGFCSGLDVRDFGAASPRPTTRRSTGCVSRSPWPHCRRRSGPCRNP